MDSPGPVTFFNLFVTGQIEAATFPMGPDTKEVFCRYETIVGPDWEQVTGISYGISQTASNCSGNYNDKIIFNMPIEQTFKSTNPHGWPQILISMYGKTGWGIQTCIGYARVHVPVFGGEDRHLTAPLLIPKCPTLLEEIAHWITGRNPELKNPSMLLDNWKCKGLAVESYGEVRLKLNVVARGIRRMGYDWG